MIASCSFACGTSDESDPGAGDTSAGSDDGGTPSTGAEDGSSDDGPDGTGGGGATGDVGTGVGGGGTGGGDAGPEPNQEDFEALSACFETSPCERAWVQGGEDGVWGRGVGCVVTALRDRTPGIYHLDLYWTVENAEQYSDYSYVITPTGAVEVGRRMTYWNDETEGGFEDPEEWWVPTQRCAPKPSAFFDECLVDVVEDGGQPECVWNEEKESEPPWLEDCVEQPPTCE